MTPRERLAALVAIESAREDYSGKIEKGPWIFSANGQEWVIATEGHILVAVRPGSVAVGDFAKAPAMVEGLAGKFFAAESFPPTETVKAGDLKAFVGLRDNSEPCACAGSGRVECKNCDGSGDVTCTCDCGDEHEKSCSDCRGRGDRKCACGGVVTRSYAMWLNAPMDRGLLATVLHAVSPLDDDEIQVSIQPHKNVTVFYMQASDDSVRALLMPCREVPPSDGTRILVVFENRETWEPILESHAATIER